MKTTIIYLSIFLPLIFNFILSKITINKLNYISDNEKINTYENYKKIEGALGFFIVFAPIILSSILNVNHPIEIINNNLYPIFKKIILLTTSETNFLFSIFHESFQFFSSAFTMFFPFLIFTQIGYAVDEKFNNSKMNKKIELKESFKLLLTILVPIFIFIFTFEYLIFEDFTVFSFITLIILFSFTIFSIQPKFIELIHKTEPLIKINPILYEKILQQIKKENISISDLKIINSNNKKESNSFISGLLPFYRKIFITDYLLETFSDEEILLMMSYNIAHIKQKHWLKIFSLNIIYSLSSFIIIYSSFDNFIDFIGIDSLDLAILGCVLFFIFIYTPFFERHFIYKADELVINTNDYQSYLHLLDKIALINKISIKDSVFDVFFSQPSIEKRKLRITQKNKD